MFLKDVIAILESFSPTKYAASWDNVGLLVEPSVPKEIKSIMLTNDLTLDVIEEAIANNTDFILSYHPPIFQGLKTIDQSSVRGQIISRCLENKLAVFSPHTSYDVMLNGVNDWLISPFNIYSPKVLPIKATNIESQEGSTAFGEGRILYFEPPFLEIKKIIEIMKSHLRLKSLRLAMGRKSTLESQVKSIACCAGAGATVLQNVSADFYITGEMPHHSILDSTERGVSLLLTEHTNSERGFLGDVLRPLLIERLGPGVMVKVSEKDREPVEIV